MYFTDYSLEGSLRWVVPAFLGFTVVGLVDAVYLTASHFSDNPLSCTFIEGCDVVLASSYATIVGIPTAALGIVYYGALFGLVLWGLIRLSYRHVLIAASLSIIGLLASGIFIFIQLGVLKAVCQFCMLSAFTSGVLWILGMYMLHRYRKNTGADTSP